MTSDFATADAARWMPVAFGRSDGARVEFWRNPLPEKFPDQLENDPVGLRQRAAEETAACGGWLIDAVRVTVAGRLALMRIERLASQDQQTESYAASLLVPLDGEVLVEVTITCCDRDGDDLVEEVGTTPLARVLRVMEETASGIRFPPPWG